MINLMEKEYIAVIHDDIQNELLELRTKNTDILNAFHNIFIFEKFLRIELKQDIIVD